MVWNKPKDSSPEITKLKVIPLKDLLVIKVENTDGEKSRKYSHIRISEQPCDSTSRSHKNTRPSLLAMHYFLSTNGGEPKNYNEKLEVYKSIE